jgi:FlaG/FlaF family flagellin (archaellin)
MSDWITVVLNALMIAGMVIMVFHKSGKSQSTMEQKQESDHDSIAKVEVALSNHTSDLTPHKACLEHAATLKSIDTTLKQFAVTINTLDVRVYEMVKNGGKRPTEYGG